MNAELLQAMGLTQEEIQERVIERIVESLMNEEEAEYDEDTGRTRKTTRAGQLERELKAVVKERIDAQVIAIADEHLTPRIREIIESVKLQKTNGYGEPKAEPMTFVEYLVTRAEAYMKEEVDLQGKPRGDRDYNWKGVQTRIAYLVHSDIHAAIHGAVQDALSNAHKLFATSLQEMVNAKLTEIAGTIKLSVQAGK